MPAPDSFATTSSSLLSSQTGWHCAGDTPVGTLHLWLNDEANAPPHTSEGVRQVRALARAEALISAIEQWLQMPWDPVPLQTSTSTPLPPQSTWPSAAAHALVRDPTLAPPGTRLALPPQLLRAVLPEALRAPRLAWESITAQVLLDVLTPEVVAARQPGALLWLPASLGNAATDGWPVHLRDTAGLWPDCPARLDLHMQRLHIAHGEGAHMGEAPDSIEASHASQADPEPEATPEANGTDSPARVVLSTPVHIPLDHWLGMGPAKTPFHWPVPQPWSAELRSAAGQQLGSVLDQGTLMHLGHGWGLRLDGGDTAPVANTGATDHIALSAPEDDWHAQHEPDPGRAWNGRSDWDMQGTPFEANDQPAPAPVDELGDESTAQEDPATPSF